MDDAASELRLDALTGDWVAISGHRQARPNLPSTDCPFCVGGTEAPDPYDVRVFENRWPALTPGDPLDVGVDETGAPARGAAEVVLYTPDHDASMASLGVGGVRSVIDVWADRTESLLARDEVAYVLVFENRGRAVGATIDHPHGQIYAFGSVPPVPARELVIAEGGCTVCAEIERERDDPVRVVHDAGGWLGWVPFASPWPYGLLVAPHAHVDGLPALDDAGRDAFAQALVDALGRYDALFADDGVGPFPYMLWVHQSPDCESAHLHVHLAPPWRSAGVPRYVAAGELGSGMYFNPVAPERAASALRAAGDSSSDASDG